MEVILIHKTFLWLTVTPWLLFSCPCFLVVLSFANVENSTQFFVELGLNLYVSVGSYCQYISNNIDFILFGAWMLKVLQLWFQFFCLFQSDKGKTEQN
jgi:hypothetical protein